MTSKEEVLRVARLARIEVPESDIPEIQKKFDAVLAHFKELESVDTSQVTAMFHAKEKMELRPDIPSENISTDALLKNCADRFESCFRIPKVVGEIES